MPETKTETKTETSETKQDNSDTSKTSTTVKDITFGLYFIFMFIALIAYSIWLAYPLENDTKSMWMVGAIALGYCISLLTYFTGHMTVSFATFLIMAVLTVNNAIDTELKVISEKYVDGMIIREKIYNPAGLTALFTSFIGIGFGLFAYSYK